MKILSMAFVCLVLTIGLDAASVKAQEAARHDSPTLRHEMRPRKVIVGTTMTPWYSNYPGIKQRLEEMESLVDQLGKQSQQQYGRGIDVAVFREYAITAGKQGTAREIAVPLNDELISAVAAIATKHRCYLIFGGVFSTEADPNVCTNDAVVIDREGRMVGRYSKVHPVFDKVDPEHGIILEGGVSPGKSYPVFDLDFGRVGLQICYDVEYPEGWKQLEDQQAEIVFFLTQSPQLTRPAAFAAKHEYWIVSSTFRHNASFFEPGTGLVAAQIKASEKTLVHEIDLSYLILPWSTPLQNGAAFQKAFGDRVGYRYSESEDRGVFWSNDQATTIGEMASSLGLLETTREQQAKAKSAQDQLRGGPAE